MCTVGKRPFYARHYLDVCWAGPSTPCMACCINCVFGPHRKMCGHVSTTKPCPPCAWRALPATAASRPCAGAT